MNQLDDLDRRGFLTRVGAGALALASARVLTDPAVAQAAPARCLGTDAVDIAYLPWRVRSPGGTIVRIAPRDDAPAVLDADARGVFLPAGAVFARQSVRNGSASDRPASRRSVNGYIWGYGVRPDDCILDPGAPSATSKRQGWARVADMTGDSAYPLNLCGPDCADFDARGRDRANPDGSRCASAAAGGNPAPATNASSKCWTISPSWFNDEIQGRPEGRVYLRWAPNSTTIFWLVGGDAVRRLAYTGELGAGDRKWSCVEVLASATCPTGQRGWIRSEALGATLASCPAPAPMPFPFTGPLT